MVRKFVVLAILLFSLMASTVSAGSPKPTWDESRESLYEVLHTLSEFEKRAIVLGVYLDTDKNSENLSSATPKNVTWSLKVLATEHKLLSELADEAGWAELSRWFKTNSDALVTLIRGERTMQQYLREQEVRKSDYQRIVNRFMSQNQSKRNVAQSDAFTSLRKDFSSFIGASARVLNGTGSG